MKRPRDWLEVFSKDQVFSSVYSWDNSLMSKLYGSDFDDLVREFERANYLGDLQAMLDTLKEICKFSRSAYQCEISANPTSRLWNCHQKVKEMDLGLYAEEIRNCFNDLVIDYSIIGWKRCRNCLDRDCNASE